jgi:hypothetical protein
MDSDGMVDISCAPKDELHTWYLNTPRTLSIQRYSGGCLNSLWKLGENARVLNCTVLKIIPVVQSICINRMFLKTKPDVIVYFGIEEIWLNVKKRIESKKLQCYVIAILTDVQEPLEYFFITCTSFAFKCLTFDSECCMQYKNLVENSMQQEKYVKTIRKNKSYFLNVTKSKTINSNLVYEKMKGDFNNLLSKIMCSTNNICPTTKKPIRAKCDLLKHHYTFHSELDNFKCLVPKCKYTTVDKKKMIGHYRIHKINFFLKTSTYDVALDCYFKNSTMTFITQTKGIHGLPVTRLNDNDFLNILNKYLTPNTTRILSILTALHIIPIRMDAALCMSEIIEIECIKPFLSVAKSRLFTVVEKIYPEIDVEVEFEKLTAVGIVKREFGSVNTGTLKRTPKIPTTLEMIYTRCPIKILQCSDLFPFRNIKFNIQPSKKQKEDEFTFLHPYIPYLEGSTYFEMQIRSLSKSKLNILYKIFKTHEIEIDSSELNHLRALKLIDNANNVICPVGHFEVRLAAILKCIGGTNETVDYKCLKSNTERVNNETDEYKYQKSNTEQLDELQSLLLVHNNLQIDLESRIQYLLRYMHIEKSKSCIELKGLICGMFRTSLNVKGAFIPQILAIVLAKVETKLSSPCTLADYFELLTPKILLESSGKIAVVPKFEKSTSKVKKSS